MSIKTHQNHKNSAVHFIENIQSRLHQMDYKHRFQVMSAHEYKDLFDSIKACAGEAAAFNFARLCCYVPDGTRSSVFAGIVDLSAHGWRMDRLVKINDRIVDDAMTKRFGILDSFGKVMRDSLKYYTTAPRYALHGYICKIQDVGRYEFVLGHRDNLTAEELNHIRGIQKDGRTRPAAQLRRKFR